MSENYYPLKQKKITVFEQEVTLRELPVAFIISVENKEVIDSLYATCKAGSDISDDTLGKFGASQLKSMYDDVMKLSYGDDWKKQAEQANPSKKN